MSHPIVPAQRVRFTSATAPRGEFDVLAVRDGLVHVRGVAETDTWGQHWCGRPEEFETVDEPGAYADELEDADTTREDD